MIATFAEKVTSILGQNNRGVRAIRPFYSYCLNRLVGNQGLAWTVNNQPLKIDPRVRHLIPKVNEPELFDFLKTNIKPGQIVLDVGSFLGTYAVFAARWVGTGGKVIAFEPTIANHAIISKHLQINDVQDRVQLIKAAVGERAGVVEFCHYAEPYMNRVPGPEKDIKALGVTKIQLVMLDSICDELGLTPDWIRMDVQGLEFDVLKGARNIIKSGRGRLRIVAEMHPQIWPELGINENMARSILDELNLRCRPLEANGKLFEPDGHVLMECV